MEAKCAKCEIMDLKCVRRDMSEVQLTKQKLPNQRTPQDHSKIPLPVAYCIINKILNPLFSQEIPRFELFLVSVL